MRRGREARRRILAAARLFNFSGPLRRAPEDRGTPDSPSLNRASHRGRAAAPKNGRPAIRFCVRTMSDGAYGRFLETLGAALRLGALLLLAITVACSWQIYRDLVQLHLMEEKVTDASIAIGAAGGDLEKTLRDEQKAAGDQLAATAATLRQTQTDLADVDAAVKHLDATLGGVNAAANSLNGAIEDNSGQMVAIEKQAERDLADFDVDEQGLEGTVNAAAGTIASANKLLADPSLPDDLTRIHSVLIHTDATSAHVDAGTADLAAAIHRETKPASFAVKTAGWIVDGAAKFGSILAGFVK